MDEKIFDLTYQLKKCLHRSRIYKKMIRYENKMKVNETVIDLAAKKDQLVLTYNRIVEKCGTESEEEKRARHELFKIKKQLDSHPLVVRYMRYYKMYRELLEKINLTIFKELNTHLCT